MNSNCLADQISALRDRFADRLQENVVLANFTTAHVGGPADALLVAHSADDLAEMVSYLWTLEAPYVVLGSGSNVLFSDDGFSGVVVLNRAKNLRIDANGEPPSVWAESGANLGGLARQVALRGLAGMEWAATIPGTVGGAVYGNAGAHGGDTAGSLMLAEILHPTQGRVEWSPAEMGYGYRTSTLKRNPCQAVILAARFKLEHSTSEAVRARMDANTASRRRTQPPGASLGSMFKNPPGDYAGRLIESAGLKGARVGSASISSVHANFFVTEPGATAADIVQLIELARSTVLDRFGVKLELEIELIGNWNLHSNGLVEG